VLTDWHQWEGHAAASQPLDARRARLRERWPEFDVGWIEGTLPAVFVTPSGAAIESDLAAWRRISSGLLLRAAAARDCAPPHEVWHRPAARRRVRAVLQYVPSDALGPNGLEALATLPSAFAIWSRAPSCARERAAGMAYSLSPLTQADPVTRAALDENAAPARLLPLVRLPLDLPAARLAALHAWLRVHAGPRFGAMNTVLPALVFTLSFEAVQESRRHRAGLTLDAARVDEWLEQAPAGEADDLGTLQAALRSS
jgi:hypothetical protein